MRCQKGTATAADARRSRFLRFLLVALAAIAILAIIGYAFRAPILAWIGNTYVVNEPLVRADAIVVLGGGPQYRPFEAARLFHAGYAPKVLVANVRRDPTDDLGITLPETDINVQVLLKQGVPKEAIAFIGKDVASTYDEAIGVRDWARQTGANRVIVPTDPFHTRRVDWIFEKLLGPGKTDVITRMVPVRDYTPDNWWRNEKGFVNFQNETLKLLYYHLHY